MEKEKLRKVPKKNYIILLVIFAISFFLIYYIYSWYKVYSLYKEDIPVIRDTLVEISKEEAENFIRENSNALVYLCTASDMECRKFESKFKVLIEKEGYSSYITYINLSDVDKETFINDFNSKYKSKKKLTNYPALIAFEDNRIVGIIQNKNNKNIKISEVKEFIEDNIPGEE